MTLSNQGYSQFILSLHDGIDIISVRVLKYLQRRYSIYIHILLPYDTTTEQDYYHLDFRERYDSCLYAADFVKYYKKFQHLMLKIS